MKCPICALALVVTLTAAGVIPTHEPHSHREPVRAERTVDAAPILVSSTRSTKPFVVTALYALRLTHNGAQIVDLDG